MSDGQRVETSDALVVGGNLAGLIVAYFLSTWGYKVRLVERAPEVGGFDQSFANANGRLFDFGMHGLDYMRSELTSKLFESINEGKFNKVERKRGLLLRNELIAYDAPPSEWPEPLRGLFPSEPLVDDIGTEPPTREALARCYGQAFADLIYDEVVASYPSEARQLDFGVEPWKLLTNIYPWFFPWARRGHVESSLSRVHQDRVHDTGKDFVLYPSSGGFGAFPLRMRERVQALGCDVITGAGDLSFDLDPATRTVRSIHAQGRRFSAPRVFWCAGPAQLEQLLELPSPDRSPDRFLLGSFEFREPLDCRFVEVIAGDPRHPINRISFPGKLSLERDDLVQVEFCFPKQSQDYGSDPAHWQGRWEQSLRELGIVSGDNAVTAFDFKKVDMFYNCYGIEGEVCPEIHFELPPESNLRPVLPTLRKININTRLPAYLEFLTREMLGR